MLRGHPEEPNMKRRRTDDEFDDDDDWGDMDFSQADLSSIDTLVASQVPSHQNNNAVKTKEKQCPKPATFAKPSSSFNAHSSLQMNRPNHYANSQRQSSNTYKENKHVKPSTDKAKQPNYAIEGQVKMLTHAIQQKDAELNKLRNEKLLMIEETARAKSEFETEQQKETEKLKTELQFKDQELREMQRRIMRLEKNKSDENQNCSQSPGMLSPSRAKNAVLKSPKTPSRGFPTRNTFMSNEGSPKKPTKDASTQGSQSTLTAPETSRIQGKRRKMGLSLNLSVGCSSGPQLIEKMFDSNTTTSSFAPSDGLLTVLSKHSDLVTRSRDKERHSSSRLETVQPQRSVDPEKQNLAKKGVEALLKSSLIDTKLSSKLNDLCSADSVLLLLPLIDEQMQGFIETHCNVKTTSAKGDSSSVDSSCGSQSTQVASAAGSSPVTDSCYGVLSSLHTLVSYSGEVCKAVLSGVPGYGSDTASQPASAGRTASRASSTDSRSMTPLPANCKAQIVSQCHIFEKLVSMSDPYHIPDKVWPGKVTAMSLSILALLAQQCSVPKLHVFLSLLPSEAVASTASNCVFHCLEHPTPIITHQVLELLKPLSQSLRIVKVFCDNKDEVCVLAKLYDAMLQIPSSYPPSQRLSLKYKFVCFISALLEEKHLDTLLTQHCVCGDEVIKTVVSLLHAELPTVELSDKDCKTFAMRLLHSGMRLLHSFSGSDRLFRAHGEKLEKYTQLVYAYEGLCGQMEDNILEEMISALWLYEEEGDEYMDMDG